MAISLRLAAINFLKTGAGATLAAEAAAPDLERTELIFGSRVIRNVAGEVKRSLNDVEVIRAIDYGEFMKVDKKAKVESAPFDPVLFAATVPSRKATKQDLADCQERADDGIQPKDHATMQGIIDDL
jgi:hypothetical protein